MATTRTQAAAMKRLTPGEVLFYAALTYFIWYEMNFYTITGSNVTAGVALLCALAATALVIAICRGFFQKQLVLSGLALILIVSLLWAYTLHQQQTANRQYEAEHSAAKTPQELGAAQNRLNQSNFELEKFNMSAVFWIALVFGIVLALVNNDFHLKPIDRALVVVTVFVGTFFYSIIAVLLLSLRGGFF